MSDNSFIHVAPSTMTPCSPFDRTLEWACPDCTAPLAHMTGIDVRIQGRSPRKSSLSFMQGARAPIAWREHLMRLGEATVNRFLYLGQVTNEGGKVLPDWVTWRGKYKTIVRGDKDAGYRECRVCGREIYSARGKVYLFPAPPDGVLVLQAGMGLVVAASLVDRLRLEEWRGVHVQSTPIVQPPLDGLPALMNPAF